MPNPQIPVDLEMNMIQYSTLKIYIFIQVPIILAYGFITSGLDSIGNQFSSYDGAYI